MLFKYIHLLLFSFSAYDRAVSRLLLRCLFGPSLSCPGILLSDPAPLHTKRFVMIRPLFADDHILDRLFRIITCTISCRIVLLS